MSPLALTLTILTAILTFAWIIAIYITNVTAKPGRIPRWVMWLGFVWLMVGTAALIAAFW